MIGMYLGTFKYHASSLKIPENKFTGTHGHARMIFNLAFYGFCISWNLLGAENRQVVPKGFSGDQSAHSLVLACALIHLKIDEFWLF